MQLGRPSSATLPARRSGRAWRLVASTLLALGAMAVGAGVAAAADPIGDAVSAVTDGPATGPLVEDVSQTAEPVVDRIVASPPVQAARPIADRIAETVSTVVPPSTLPEVPLPDVPAPNVPRPDLPVLEGPESQRPAAEGRESAAHRVPSAALELEPVRSQRQAPDSTPSPVADASAASTAHPPHSAWPALHAQPGNASDVAGLAGEAGPIAAVLAFALAFTIVARALDLSLTLPAGRPQLALVPPG